MPRRRDIAPAEISNPPLFEFCVRGPALSAQARNKRRLRTWRAVVANEARNAVTGRSVIRNEIEIHIVEFSDTPGKDRDNAAKPIQDAMQGILFENDKQVMRLGSEWCDINGRYRVRFMSPLVAKALCAGHEFVWVRVFSHRPRETLTA